MIKSNSSHAEVSVIVSIFNAKDNIKDFYTSLTNALKSVDKSIEFIFVDDASNDGTFEKLKMLMKDDDKVHIVRMRSTFGEAACLDAGLKYSKGDLIVYLSGRVNVDPSGIPAFLKKLDQGSDLVAGWRSPRKDSALNRGVSKVFNLLASWFLKQRLHDINSGILVTRREVLDKISFYGDLYNFIPVLAAGQGYKVAEEKIAQLPGSFRNSRYPKEYVQRLLDIITVIFLTRYSKKPIHFLGFVGSLFGAVGLGIEVYLFIYRILGMGPIAGRPLLILGALLLVIGIQMISIGLLGEMIIFTHAGDVAEYNIEKIIN